MAQIHFEELMEMSNALLNKLKHVMAKGTPDEKKAILKSLKLIRHLMQRHYEALKGKLNLSPEQLEVAIGLAMAQSPQLRKKLHQVKGEVEQHREDLQKIIAPLPKGKGRMKPLKNRWLRS